MRRGNGTGTEDSRGIGVGPGRAVGGAPGGQGPGLCRAHESRDRPGPRTRAGRLSCVRPTSTPRTWAAALTVGHTCLSEQRLPDT